MSGAGVYRTDWARHDVQLQERLEMALMGIRRAVW